MIDYAFGKTIVKIWDYRVSVDSDKNFMTFENIKGDVINYTYAEFDSLVNKLASAFESQGIHKGDCVLYLAQNSPEFYASLIAISKIGGIIAPISPCSTTEELEAYCKTCDPALIVYSENYRKSYIDFTAYTTSKRSRCSIETLLAESEKAPTANYSDHEVLDSDTFEIIFTSGTTSLSKAVEITHAHAAFACAVNIDAFSFRSDDRLLNIMPPFQVDAVCMEFLPCIAVGASLVLIEQYSASRFIEQCAIHNVTFVNAVAMVIRTALMQATSDFDHDNKLRLVCATMHLSQELREEFSKRFDVRLINWYGLTELASPATMDPLFGPINYASVGSALPSTNIKIIDTKGNELPTGKTGEICIKGTPGRTIMKGYLNDPEKTAETIVDGEWLLTGDLGYIGHDGSLYLVDRIKNVIKTKGQNISALEVEKVIREIPNINDVAVLGVPHDIYDEQVMAVVVSDGITEQEIIDYCRQRLTLIKIPTLIKFAPRIPLSPTGKADHKTLKRLYKTLRIDSILPAEATSTECTKSALANALLYLASTTRLEKITIGMIVNESVKNRNTFYYHFQSKAELLLWIFRNDLGERLLVIPDDIQLDYDFDATFCSYPKYGRKIHNDNSVDNSCFIRALFEVAENRSSLYSQVFSGSCSQEFEEGLLKILLEGLSEDLNIIFKGSNTTNSTAVNSSFMPILEVYALGLIGLIKRQLIITRGGFSAYKQSPLLNVISNSLVHEAKRYLLA